MISSFFRVKRVGPFRICFTVYVVFMSGHTSPCAEACSAATATWASWVRSTFFGVGGWRRLKVQKLDTLVISVLPARLSIRAEFKSAVEVSVSALCPEIALLGIPAQLLAVIRIERHFV